MTCLLLGSLGRITLLVARVLSWGVLLYVRPRITLRPLETLGDVAQKDMDDVAQLVL